MSEKKTLHNVWLIQDKVPIDESADNVPVDDPDDSERKPKYFAGLAKSPGTRFQGLNRCPLLLKYIRMRKVRK